MKKGHMRPRNIGIILALLMFFLFGSMAHQPTASAGKKKKAPTPAFLSQKSLRGSMQGMSGAALDLNGDGLKDLVVGAPLAQHRGSTGALLVYLATAKGFHKKPSAILRGDGNLGWSLVSLGDVNGDDKEDFAAGAHSGNGEYSSLAGTVTIYYGGDKPQKAFVLEGEHAMDKFGFALAAGDLNDDGFTDLVVGAPLHSPSPSLYQQGAVYIYFGGSGPDYGPSHAVKISASNVNRGIGFSLAVGDISNDGVDDLLMGASGKVIGYTGGSGFPSTATASPDLVFSSTDRGFGRAISVIWDVDDDGYNDVAVGAYQAQIDNTDIGRLFILKGGEKNSTPVYLDTNPPPDDLLIRIDGEPNCGQFATAILPLGDVDGDGAPELAVSAVHADGEPWAMTGKIFIFSGSTLTDAGTTVDSARSIAGEARDMHLGTFLAMVGDGSWLAAGAPTEKANTGRVRLYDLAPPESNSKREKK